MRALVDSTNFSKRRYPLRYPEAYLNDDGLGIWLVTS